MFWTFFAFILSNLLLISATTDQNLSKKAQKLAQNNQDSAPLFEDEPIIAHTTTTEDSFFDFGFDDDESNNEVDTGQVNVS